MLFRYKGRPVTSQQKNHFFLSLLHLTCHLILYLYACAIENPEISGLYVSKIRAVSTEHKRAKEIET